MRNSGILGRIFKVLGNSSPGYATNTSNSSLKQNKKASLLLNTL